MTWHLKDKQLEEKLIGLCSNFLEALNNGVYSKRKDENYILVSFDREKLGNYLDGNELLFWMDELEEVHDYNPKAWNEYPKVKPPYDVMMRIELRNGLKFGAYFRHFENGDRWCNPKHLLMSETFSNLVTRFRPWED